MAIKSFLDIEAYQILYEACILVHKEIVPKLPKSEKYSLVNQTSRASKSPVALIAEGYARKDYKKH